MHSPFYEEIFELIPSTKVSIEEALSYLVKYRKSLQENKTITDKYIKLHRTNDPVEIHYTLIKRVNDDDLELNKVCKLLEKYMIPIKFIRFNPINSLERSANEEKWTNTIKEKVPTLRIKIYSPPGREVCSSCGEFTKYYYHEEIETDE